MARIFKNCISWLPFESEPLRACSEVVFKCKIGAKLNSTLVSRFSLFFGLYCRMRCAHFKNQKFNFETNSDVQRSAFQKLHRLGRRHTTHRMGCVAKQACTCIGYGKADAFGIVGLFLWQRNAYVYVNLCHRSCAGRTGKLRSLHYNVEKAMSHCLLGLTTVVRYSAASHR